jgi:hypothetical protein
VPTLDGLTLAPSLSVGSDLLVRSPWKETVHCVNNSFAIPILSLFRLMENQPKNTEIGRTLFRCEMAKKWHDECIQVT